MPSKLFPQQSIILFLLFVGTCFTFFILSCGKDDIKEPTPDPEPTEKLNSLFDISAGPYVTKKDIILTNKSTLATSYLWDFGDNKTSTEESPKHQYSTDGDYIIKLTAFDAAGQTSISQKPLGVVKNPDLLFGDITTTNTMIYGEPFIANANASSSATSIQWNMGDGSPMLTGAIIGHTYETPGSYTVNVTLSDGTNSKTISKLFIANIENDSWIIDITGLALSHASGVGGSDDGVWGLFEFDVVELKENGTVEKTIGTFDNLWEEGESDRIQATNYPADNSIIGNINIGRVVILDRTKWKKGLYQVNYTSRFEVRHKDCGICAWGSVRMGTEQTKSFIIGNPGIQKGDLFETDSDNGRKHFFRPQFRLTE